MLALKKIFFRLLYQGPGDNKLRCYEVAALNAFRNALSPHQQIIFDGNFAMDDEVIRQENGKIFWTSNWLNSCGGASLKSYPQENRMFGTEGTGSVKVATIEITSEKVPNKTIHGDVYYADGIGPTIYFNASPSKHFDINEECIQVGKALNKYHGCTIPKTTALLIS